MLPTTPVPAVITPSGESRTNAFETALDVRKARDSEAMARIAHANFAVAKTEAEVRNHIAKDRCDVLGGATREVCLRVAGKTLASGLAVATSARETALEAAGRAQ